MKTFTYVDGCTVTSIKVDNNDFTELSENEKIESIKTLIDYVCNQPHSKERNDLLLDAMTLFVPEISTDEKEFQYDDDNENNIISVYTYKDDKDKIIVIDDGFDEKVIINDHCYLGYKIDDEIKQVFNKVIEKSGNNSYLNNIFMDIVRKYGEGGFLYHCNQCGDSVYEYTLKIENGEE